MEGLAAAAGRPSAALHIPVCRRYGLSYDPAGPEGRAEGNYPEGPRPRGHGKPPALTPVAWSGPVQANVVA